MPSLRFRSLRSLSRSRSRIGNYDSDSNNTSSSSMSPSPTSSATSSSSSSVDDLSANYSSSGRSSPKKPSHSSIWYHPDETVTLSLPKRTRRLFEDYSKIPKDEVESHILYVREKAWDVHSYACIGGFRFLDGSIHWTPQFESILARLKGSRGRSRSRSGSPTSRPGSSHLLSSRPSSSSLLSAPTVFSSRSAGAKLLDLGCGLGQDLRFFAFRGAPPRNLYGLDLYPEFIELGYELFNDGSKIPRENFFTGDIFDPESLNDGALDHGMDIVHAGAFLHMFSWEQQVAACERMVGFLKAEEGATVFGRHLGTTNPGVYMGRDKCASQNPYKDTDDYSERWRHDAASFERLWEEVGKRTGSTWKVDVDMKDFQKENGKSYGDPALRRMLFCVTRLA